MLEEIPKKKFDVLLLDIYMGEMSGMQVAKEIRKLDENILIVFITSSQEFAVESYRVQASDYLLKPISYNGLCETMGRIMKILKLDTKIIEILSNRVRTKIKVSSIMFAEVFNTVCIIHTTDEEFRTYITLDELSATLDEEKFIRCHRSYLINMDYIEKIEEHNFLMKDGMTIPIGRKKSSEIKQKFHTYQFEQMKCE